MSYPHSDVSPPSDVPPPVHPELNRRRFLVTSAAAFAGAAFGATPAPAKIFRRNDASEARAIPGYHGYLASLRLRRLTPESILAAHDKCRGSVHNCLPPKSLWSNMKPTLRVADEIAKRIGSPPSKIISAFRSPSYNKRIGGARQSQHMRNCALDLQFACGSSKASQVARQLRDEGFFTGGIGVYSGFIHIDTRGTNKTW